MPQRDSLIYKKVPTGISYIFLMLMGAVALLLFYLYIDFTEEFEDLYNKRAGGGNGDIFDSLDDNRQNNQEEKSE